MQGRVVSNDLHEHHKGSGLCDRIPPGGQRRCDSAHVSAHVSAPFGSLFADVLLVLGHTHTEEPEGEGGMLRLLEVSGMHGAMGPAEREVCTHFTKAPDLI